MVWLTAGMSCGVRDTAVIIVMVWAARVLFHDVRSTGGTVTIVGLTLLTFIG